MLANVHHLASLVLYPKAAGAKFLFAKCCTNTVTHIPAGITVIYISEVSLHPFQKKKKKVINLKRHIRYLKKKINK